jgi:hypothetical protein
VAQTALTTSLQGDDGVSIAAALATQAPVPSGALVVIATRAAPSTSAPPATTVVPEGQDALSGPLTARVLVAV